jgi:squalene synthase HpnC
VNTAVATQVEIPSGKDAAYENFPVGSWLLPASVRPHVAVFYGFARAIDDIADSDSISPHDKIDRLEEFAQAIGGEHPDDPQFEKAHRMRESLIATDVTPQHCLDLITAFKSDATKLRYADWDDLIEYCQLSAAPVGRYLLDIHGENTSDYKYSDALCNALQVINHLQDCQDDYLTLDRVYLPAPWLSEAGIAVEDLKATSTSSGLRQVLDRTLTGVEGLMPAARELPARLSNRRLAMESAVIVRIADKLITKLRSGDPLASRVALSKIQYANCCVSGTLSVLLSAGHGS